MAWSNVLILLSSLIIPSFRKLPPPYFGQLQNESYNKPACPLYLQQFERLVEYLLPLISLPLEKMTSREAGYCTVACSLLVAQSRSTGYLCNA